MDKATRIKLLDEAPVRPPKIVTKLYGITAACMIVGFIPAALFVFYVWSRMAELLRGTAGLRLDTPVFVLCLAAFLLCYGIPMAIGFRAASLYALSLTKFYLDHGQPERAEKVAEAFATKIWWLHARRRPWFRKFVVERGLNERVPRYAKYKA